MLGSWGSASPEAPGTPSTPIPAPASPASGDILHPQLLFRSRVKQENGRGLPFAATPPGIPAHTKALPWLCLLAVPGSASAAEQHRQRAQVAPARTAANQPLHFRFAQRHTPQLSCPRVCSRVTHPWVPHAGTDRRPQAPRATGICPSLSHCIPLLLSGPWVSHPTNQRQTATGSSNEGQAH